MRSWGFLPGQRAWLRAAVLFVWTLLFAVYLLAAFAEGTHAGLRQASRDGNGRAARLLSRVTR